MKHVRVVLIATMLTLGPCAAAFAQRPSAPVGCGELGSLTDAVRTLVDIEREAATESAKNQRLEMAIAYLQFRSRRIESLEGDLRRAEEQRERAARFVDQLEGDMKLREEQFENATPEKSEQIRFSLERARANIESQKKALGVIEVRIIDLRNEIDDGKRRLSEFENYVLENLDLE